MNSRQKTMLVTGATGEIGQAIVAKAIGCGYFVIAFGRDQKKLTDIKEKHGNDVHIVSQDLRLDFREEIEEKLRALKTVYPKIDVIVNSAGLLKWDDEYPGENLAEKTRNAWKDLMELNFESKVQFVFSFKKIYGVSHPTKIVNVSSWAATFPPNEAKEWKEVAYAHSMQSLSNWTRESAKRDGEPFIFLLLEPGIINTEMARRALTPERVGRIIVWKEEKQPEEFADEVMNVVEAA